MNRREAIHALSTGVLAGGAVAASDPPGVSAGKLRAKWIAWCADDFVVDLWHNGRVVPVAQRSLIHEIYGATVERAEVALKAGDWLVFHVVHNRMRWNGCKFFGMVGMAAENEASLVSTNGKEWSAADFAMDAFRFIRERDYLKDKPAKLIPLESLWDQGYSRLHELCGGKWHGTPIWGEAASCWLKLRVE